MSVSRRDFNRLALAGLAGLSAVGSGRALASVSASDRKFLFVFARGGWDYSYVFAPLFDNSFCDTDPSSAPATAPTSPMRVMIPSTTSTSAGRRGAPVPSTSMAPRSTRCI